MVLYTEAEVTALLFFDKLALCCMTTCMLPVLYEYITGSDVYGRVMLFNHTLSASWNTEFLTNCTAYLGARIAQSV
jgi:hypothetical protein